MATLYLKNQELETALDARDLSSIVDGLIQNTTPIPDVDILEVNKVKSYLYATNNLICTIDEGTSTEMKFGDPKIRVNGFWKMTDFSADGTEFVKYQRFNTPADVELFTPGRISIKIRESDRTDVEEAYKQRKIPKPDYGMLLVILNFVNSEGGDRKEKAYLLKYTHNPLFSIAAITSNSLVDLTSLFNVYRSPPYSAESFFIPNISSRFFYNFFEPQESDYDVYARRDYKGKKLSDIPKFIVLKWNTPSFDSDKFERENKPIELVNGVFLFGEDLARGLTSQLINKVNMTRGLINLTNPPPPPLVVEVSEEQTQAIRDAIQNNPVSQNIPQNIPTGGGALGMSETELNALGAAITQTQETTQLYWFPPPPGGYGGTTTTTTTTNNQGSVVNMGGTMVTMGGNDQDLSNHLSNAGSESGAQASTVFDGGGVADIDSSELRRAVAEGGLNINIAGITNPAIVDVMNDFQARMEFFDSVSFAHNTDYIGYVIEKSRLREDGEFEVVDLIAISGRYSSEYIDWKIAYGETYSYRIRSVFRYVNKYETPMFADTDTALSRAQSAKYIDEKTSLKPNKTFYFDSVYSDPQEVQTTEANRPAPPSNIRIFANSKKRNIFITWNQKNQNRDVIGFNVYRKIFGSNQSFIRLNNDPIGIRNNSFLDEDIQPGIKYVYTVEAVDFHGNFSALSTQHYINTVYIEDDSNVIEVPQRFFETEGKEIGDTSSLEEQNLFVCKNNFAINVNPLFKNTDQSNTFVVRITSLDTGEKKEIKINFKTQTIYHILNKVPAQRQTLAPFEGTPGFFDAATIANLGRYFGNSGT